MAARRTGRPRRGRPHSAAAPLPCAADPLPTHGGPGRRRPGPRAARRGVPRPCLPGRAVRAAVPGPALPGGLPRAAPLPAPPPRPRVRRGRAIGRRSALYPWQSGSDGREETQQLHLNPRSGRWLPDHSRLQRHVGSTVAYNVWRYCEASGDGEFLHTKGAEPSPAAYRGRHAHRSCGPCAVPPRAPAGRVGPARLKRPRGANGSPGHRGDGEGAGRRFPRIPGQGVPCLQRFSRAGWPVRVRQPAVAPDPGPPSPRSSGRTG